MRRGWSIRAVSAWAALLSVLVLCVGVGAEPRVDGELALEQRLMAPCCWVQTLDVHDSPIAEELRIEIHRRLKAGEPAAKIEADLVQRYGERIRAMPPGNPLAKTALVVLAAIAAAGLMLIAIVRRWVKRQGAADAAVAPQPDAPERDEWDEKLDEQLRKMQ
jgi:cytochrome c-type biogenesis protein CcmH